MTTAAEIMNRSFFSASPMDSIGPLLHQMAERGLGLVPILDLAGRPLGLATAGEIETCYDLEEVADRLARPALCLDQNTPLDVAARALALHRADKLLLVDEHGVAVGALSALELLRATLGINGTPRVQTPERDACWDEADYLELSAAHRASEAPGIILLSPGVDSSAKRVVWAEAASNMRERLDEMLRNPQEDPRLEAMLDVYPRSLRFRCLTVFDAEQRETLASALCTADAATEVRDTERPPADPEPLPRSMVVGRSDRHAQVG